MTVRVLLLAVVASAAGVLAQAPPGATVFEDARLITPERGAPVDNSVLVVQDGRITAVGRRGDVQVPAGAARVGLGTDMGGGGPAYFGLSSHVELESLVKAGLTPAEAIGAATRTSAEFLGLRDLGTLAVGKRADFIVLDADPLENIGNTRKIAAVYFRGRPVNPAALREKWRRSG
jgi:imidazolonepropionase-like amidohydrolase